MRNQPRNREIKTNPDPWESTKEQRNQNNPYPWEINPKNREIISDPYHEKSTQRTHREIKTNSYPWEIKPKNTEKSKPKTQTTIQNYRNQIAQITPQTQDLWDEKR